jgi:hypothetical protein
MLRDEIAEKYARWSGHKTERGYNFYDEVILAIIEPELEKADRYWEIREIIMRGMPRLAELEEKARKWDELLAIPEGCSKGCGKFIVESGCQQIEVKDEPEK